MVVLLDEKSFRSSLVSPVHGNKTVAFWSFTDMGWIKKNARVVSVADMVGEWINLGDYAESGHQQAIVYEYTAQMAISSDVLISTRELIVQTEVGFREQTCLQELPWS